MSGGWLSQVSAFVSFVTGTDVKDIQKLQKTFDKFSSQVTSLLERYNTLSNKVHTQRSSFENLKDSLINARHQVKRYVECVRDLRVYGSDEERIRGVKAGIARGDFTQLTRFTNGLLNRYQKPALDSCKEAEETLEKLRSAMIESVEDCKKLATEAKSRKQYTWLVGGVLVLGEVLAATGAKISTLSEVVLTMFGTLFIICATYLLCSDFATNETDFEELSQKYKGVLSSVREFLDHTRQNKEYLIILSDKINLVNRTRETLVTPDAHSEEVISAFNLLSQYTDENVQERSEQTVFVSESIGQAAKDTESSTNDLTFQLKEFTDDAKSAIDSTHSKLNEAKVDCGPYVTTLCSHLGQSADVSVSESIGQAAKDTESSANDLTFQLKEFTNEAKRAIGNTRSKLNEAKVDCGLYRTTLCSHLSQSADKAYMYISDVSDLYYYGRDRERIYRVKEGMTQGNFEELKGFLEQLQRCIVRCELSYQETCESFREVEESSDRAADHCKKQGQKERNKKKAIRAVGGAAAGGVLAVGVVGGVAASVVAGVFTFGVGTIVGLSITAVGSVAGGSGIAAATGVATHFIASNFAESERAFKELSRSFSDVRSSAHRVLDHARTIKIHLCSISKSLDDAEHFKNSEAVGKSLNAALDRLCEKFGEAYVQSSVCRDTLKELKENM